MVKEAIFDAFPATVWIVAEISELRFARNGHCYLELIEKDEDSDNIIAKSRAAIWKRTCNIIKPYFEMTTGQELASGMKVLINVSVDFHELYSFNLSILDIDPAYTIGDLAKRRQEIISQLEKEGVIDMNKELVLPIVPQRIAIISSSTAAGLGDFMDQLNTNPYGIKFYAKLFPAIVQGEQAEGSIMEAFDRIYNYEDFFDVVCLIRGGGSKSDLSCFDSYDLAYYITQFPLPVLTGIGHERDDSIADQVAHSRLKTPTAVAEFLIEKTSAFATELDNLESRFVTAINTQIDDEKYRLNQISLAFVPKVQTILHQKQNGLQRQVAHRFQNTTSRFVNTHRSLVDSYMNNVRHTIEKRMVRKQTELDGLRKLLVIRKNRFLLKKHHQLEMMENSNEHLNPSGILKRGYSITLLQGKALKNVSNLKIGDQISTRLNNGNIESKVGKIME